jgi:hypothetical protein
LTIARKPGILVSRSDSGADAPEETVMAKDWKQVAKEQKLVIAELKALNREHEAWDKRQQRMYARLEKASLFYFREMERLGKLVKRLEAKKA